MQVKSEVSGWSKWLEPFQVLLHPHMAHAVAPRYVPSGVRVMVYFRLQRPSPAVFERSERETCQEVPIPSLDDVDGYFPGLKQFEALNILCMCHL